MIDVAISADRNCAHKEAERKIMQEFMYRDKTNVAYEMCDYIGNKWRRWNSNKNLKKNLEALPRKHSIDSLQKTATLETLDIIRKVQQSEARSVGGGDHCSGEIPERKRL
jgi:hypothetical protein